MRILSLDIGTYSIKMVEIETSFKKFEVQDFQEVILDPLSPQPLDQLLPLVEKLKKRPDKIVTSLDSTKVTIRNLEIPTKDKKAIQSAIQFELEDELPFTEENIAFDYAILSQSKNSTYAHIEATLKKYIAETIDGYQTSGVDPDFLTTYPWAFRSLLSQMNVSKKPDSDAVVIVHLGHKNTSLYMHHKGGPVADRHLAVGGMDITQAISKKYGIPLPEAERAKKENGFVLLPEQRDRASRDQMEFSNVIEETINSILVETRQFSLSAIGFTQKKPGILYLSGPTSLIPGLKQKFEEHVKVPTAPLRAMSAVSSSNINYSEITDATYGVAMANALAVIAADKVKPIQFRKGEFARAKSSSKWNAEVIRKPLISMATIGVCFLLSMVVQNFYYSNQIEKADNRLRTSIKGFLGGLTTSALNGYIDNPSKLKDAIDKKLQTQRTLAQLFSENPKSPLNFLKSLSKEIPKSLVTDMIDFQVGSSPDRAFEFENPQEVRMTFLVEGPQVKERLVQAMQSALTEVVEGKPEQVPAPDGQGQKWKIQISGKPKGDFYAR